MLFLSGCLTPEARREQRISRNPDLFYSFPEAIQEKVRRGEVDIGFNEQMTRMSLGQPEKIFRRKDADGVSVSWQYYSSTRYTDYERVHVPVTHVDDDGNSHIHYEWVTVDRDRWEEELRTQVEFEDGAVVSVETLE